MRRNRHVAPAREFGFSGDDFRLVGEVIQAQAPAAPVRVQADHPELFSLEPAPVRAPHWLDAGRGAIIPKAAPEPAPQCLDAGRGEIVQRWATQAKARAERPPYFRGEVERDEYVDGVRISSDEPAELSLPIHHPWHDPKPACACVHDCHACRFAVLPDSGERPVCFVSRGYVGGQLPRPGRCPVCGEASPGVLCRACTDAKEQAADARAIGDRMGGGDL